MAVTIDLNTGLAVFAGQSVVTDDTSTSVALHMKANRQYVYKQPLIQLTIESVDNSVLESEILFTAGDSISVAVPSSVGVIAMPTFTAGKSYAISIKNGIAVGAEYTPGGEA
jgi:hypothetical protein